MNLFPEPRPGGRSGGEAGAARGCSAPAPSRRAAGLAGVGYGCPFRRSVAHPAFRSPFRRLRRCSFFGGLLPKAFFGGPSRRHGLPTPFCRRSFFGGPSLRGGAAFFCARRNGPLCPLSSLPPLRSVPSPLRPLSAPSRSRPVPVPVPSLGGAPLRRFFSVRGLKNRKNCLDL
jgi:hypothetical protein